MIHLRPTQVKQTGSQHRQRCQADPNKTLQPANCILRHIYFPMLGKLGTSLQRRRLAWHLERVRLETRRQILLRPAMITIRCRVITRLRRLDSPSAVASSFATTADLSGDDITNDGAPARGSSGSFPSGPSSISVADDAAAHTAVINAPSGSPSNLSGNVSTWLGGNAVIDAPIGGAISHAASSTTAFHTAASNAGPAPSVLAWTGDIANGLVNGASAGGSGAGGASAGGNMVSYSTPGSGLVINVIYDFKCSPSTR